MKHTLIVLCAGGLLLASCGEKKPGGRTETTDIIPVKVLEIAPGEASGTIEATGNFTTDDETYLSFKSGGIINRILVKEGDAVKKGQLLASLDLTEINAQVAQYKLAVEKARRDYERANNLYRDSVATLEQLQNAKTALDLSTQQLQAAEFNLDHSRILAPENGFVLKKMASEGQLTGPGTPVLVTNGAGSGKWVLKVGLSDKQWSVIAVNDAADVSTDTRPNETVTGKVIRKSEGVDPASGILTADIQLSSNMPGGVAAGMFGKVSIHYGHKAASSSVFALPYEAVMDGDGRTGYVFVTTDNQTAHRVKVTIDNLMKDKVVIGSGLEGVKSVIVTGSAYLAENSRIKIIK